MYIYILFFSIICVRQHIAKRVFNHQKQAKMFSYPPIGFVWTMTPYGLCLVQAPVFAQLMFVPPVQQVQQLPQPVQQVQDQQPQDLWCICVPPQEDDGFLPSTLSSNEEEFALGQELLQEL